MESNGDGAPEPPLCSPPFGRTSEKALGTGRIESDGSSLSTCEENFSELATLSMSGGIVRIEWLIMIIKERHINKVGRVPLKLKDSKVKELVVVEEAMPSLTTTNNHQLLIVYELLAGLE